MQHILFYLHFASHGYCKYSQLISVSFKADDIKKVASNKVEPLAEETTATVEGSESSSCNGSEEEAIVAIHMDSLSLSALDQKKNEIDEGKGDRSTNGKRVIYSAAVGSSCLCKLLYSIICFGCM